MYGVRTKDKEWHLNKYQSFTNVNLPNSNGIWAEFDTKEKALFAGVKYGQFKRDELEAIELN